VTFVLFVVKIFFLKTIGRRLSKFIRFGVIADKARRDWPNNSCWASVLATQEAPPLSRDLARRAELAMTLRY
jgi:hypothetical protein